MSSVVSSSNLGSDFDLGNVESQKINVRRATSTVYGVVRSSDFLSSSTPVSLTSGSTVTAPTLSDNSAAVVSSAWVKAQNYLTSSGGAFSATTLSVTGSTALGVTSSDVLTVNALSSFTSAVNFSGTATFTSGVNIGNASTDVLTVESSSVFNAPVSFNNTVSATTFTGALAGNAATTTKLATARTLAATGDVVWSAAFDGSANVSSAATLSTTGVGAGTYTKLTVDAKGRVTSATNLSAADVPALGWSKITTGLPNTLSGYGIIDAVPLASLGILNGVATLDATGKVPVAQLPSEVTVSNLNWSVITTGKPTTLSGYGITDAVPVSSVNVANGVAGLDSTGKLPAGLLPSYVDTIVEVANYAALPATGTTNTIYMTLDNSNVYRWSGSVYVLTNGSTSTTDALAEGTVNLYFTAARAQAAVTSIPGNAVTSSRWATARSITITGDASWTTSIDGALNVSSALTLADTTVTPGTYAKLTVDSKGRATSGESLVASDIPVLDWGKITTGKPTTLAGYGISDAQPLDGDLTAIAAIAGTTGLLRKTAANTWSLDTSAFLTGNQSITVTGDVTGSGTTALTLTLGNSGVVAGTYNNSATAVTPFTVDAKGRVTSAGAAVTLTPAFASITGKPTTLAGYGITDAAPVASPAFTGVPTVPTATSGTTTQQVASTAFVMDAVASLAAGNVTSAARLSTPRTIAATGDATWSTTFDGSAGVSAVLTLAASGVTAGTYNSATAVTPITVDAKGRLTSVGAAITITPSFASVTGKPTTIAGYGITDAASSANFSTRAHSLKADESAGVKAIINPTTGLGYSGGLRVRLAYHNNVDTAAGHADVIDLSTGSDSSTGGFNSLSFSKAAQSIQHRYAAAAGTTWTTKTVAYTDGNISGNAATATTLATTRNISITADATGTATFNGSADASIALTLAASGVTGGTYKSVTVDTKGRVTGGTNPTTLAGYGIVDAAPSSHVGSGATAHAAVTTSVAGFMSAADKTKLDGIATGATANVGTVTGVTATAPVASTGGTAPVISMAAATASVNGYMTSTYASKLDGIAAGAQVNTVASVAGKTGIVTLASSDVGLGSVNNTSDADKPVSTATTTALNLKADKASPTFTGVVNTAANGLVVGTNQLLVSSGSVLINTTTVDTSAKLNIDGAINANVLRERKVVMGAGTSIDMQAGVVFSKTISGNTTFTVSNVPAAGLLGSILMEVTNGGAYLITWFATIQWPSGMAPLLSVSGKDSLFFYTHDGGTTWNGFLLGKGIA